MMKKVRILIYLILIVLAIISFPAQAQGSQVAVITVNGAINPVLADHIARGIQIAEDDNAVACVIQLDTPGGLDTAMRDIVQSIVNADVPIVVFVSPSGARAASAGVFITMSAHVAVMAPNTAIGAASPVSIGDTGLSETMEDKVMNDAAAYIRSIAEAQGRNYEWAEEAVRKAVSITEKEALEINVIDLVASDLDDLLEKIDGREVTLLNGETIVLDTDEVSVSHIQMTAVEGFLNAIADPNIAYLLLSLAGLGILVEIFNPGLIFPGIIGAISGLLAFYALGMLPVNYAGVLLMLLALGLFVAEAFTPTFGLLTAGGVISLTIGSLILFKGGSALFRVNPWLIAIVVIIIVAALYFIIRQVISVQRRQPITGKEELSGKTALVKKTLNPEGMVLYRGELWRAVSEEEEIKDGEEVIINRMQDLTLYVNKKGGK